MPMSPRLLRPRQTGSDPDALRYIAAVQAADGQPLEAGVRKAINDFIVGCKRDNIWSALKASCILAGARTLAGALTPLVGAAPTNNNFVSGDYDRKTGLIGNGSTKYLNSNRANSADGQNNNHNAVYVATVGSGIAIASAVAVTGANSIGAAVVRSRNAAGDSVAIATGFNGTSRAASGSYAHRAASTSTTFTRTSETPHSGNVLILLASNSFGTHRVAFYSVGEAIDLALLDARVTALINAIGAALAPNYADADVNAYITAVELADGGLMLEPGVRDAIDAFITGCKADGIWSAIKASCILAGARTLAGALVPLVGAAPTNFNFVSGDYNRKTGLVGDASTKYLDSGRNNNADAQNSQHLAVYASSLGTFVFSAYIGSGATNNHSRLIRGGGGTFLRGNIRSALVSSGSVEAVGFLGVSRSNSVDVQFRGSQTTSTVAAASLSPASGNVFLYNTTAAGGSNARLAFYSIGEGLGLALLDARVTSLINAIGAAIP